MLSLVVVLRGSLMNNLLHYIRATITQDEKSIMLDRKAITNDYDRVVARLCLNLNNYRE